MMKNIILGTALAATMMACGHKEQARLQTKIDSLQTELQTSQQMATTLQEVGVLMDSIDASRQALRTNVIEGTSYSDYASRLKDINAHVKATEMKIAELEKTLKSSKSASSSYLATVKKLKADLASREEQLVALQGKIDATLADNQRLVSSVNERDSLIAIRSEIIKVNEEDIHNLEAKVENITTTARMTEADRYFEQAKALEMAADRTHFAPKKKKETIQEALDMYKVSFSLGKSEAQPKIEELEKDLS